MSLPFTNIVVLNISAYGVNFPLEKWRNLFLFVEICYHKEGIDFFDNNGGRTRSIIIDAFIFSIIYFYVYVRDRYFLLHRNENTKKENNKIAKNKKVKVISITLILILIILGIVSLVYSQNIKLAKISNEEQEVEESKKDIEENENN